MERDGDRQEKMEELCSIGQRPQRAVVPVEEEEEEEQEEEEDDDDDDDDDEDSTSSKLQLDHSELQNKTSFSSL
jgi:hypothetical protein